MIKLTGKNKPIKCMKNDMRKIKVMLKILGMKEQTRISGAQQKPSKVNFSKI